MIYSCLCVKIILYKENNYPLEAFLFELQKYQNTVKDFKEQLRYINQILTDTLYILLIILKLLDINKQVKIIRKTASANELLAKQFDQHNIQVHWIIWMVKILEKLSLNKFVFLETTLKSAGNNFD